MREVSPSVLRDFELRTDATLVNTSDTSDTFDTHTTLGTINTFDFKFDTSEKMPMGCGHIAGQAAKLSLDWLQQTHHQRARYARPQLHPGLAEIGRILVWQGRLMLIPNQARRRDTRSWHTVRPPALIVRRLFAKRGAKIPFFSLTH
jgi:hypothetical protein